MRILVHDYSGHPFQMQLSRWLAAQGHAVCHCYSSAIQTPHGAMSRQPEDPQRLEIAPITLDEPFAKYSLLRRYFQELTYAKRLLARAEAFGPDIVLSGNAAPEIQRRLLNASHNAGRPFVFWVQDIYSFAIARRLNDRLPPLLAPLAGLIGGYFGRLEFGAMARSQAVVTITEDFTELLAKRGVERNRVTVIENWAPLEEMPSLPKENAWRQAQGLENKFLFLYSGTLGLKHNPGLLSALATRFEDDPAVRVVVVSEGLGRDWLEAEKARLGLDNLLLLDFQPYDRLPQVLASAEVLLAILEPFAGVLSVPSKVLSYLCAGRPLLAAIPPENLAARLIAQSGAGVALPPDQEAAFLDQAVTLREDAALRQRAAEAARAYAEWAFDIETIGQRFLSVLELAAQQPLGGRQNAPLHQPLPSRGPDG